MTIQKNIQHWKEIIFLYKISIERVILNISAIPVLNSAFLFKYNEK